MPPSLYLFLTSLNLQKRKLDAVYYYMRSLASSNPILTAKESLMSLFEEAKRKVGHSLLVGPKISDCNINQILTKTTNLKSRVFDSV